MEALGGLLFRQRTDERSDLLEHYGVGHVFREALLDGAALRVLARGDPDSFEFLWAHGLTGPLRSLSALRDPVIKHDRPGAGDVQTETCRD